MGESKRERNDRKHDLNPRIRPVQKRARETVDMILTTASELLGEVGVDAFTTNLLAERAGVAVRSVYRYYPNKFAVIVALYERHISAWQPYFDAAVRTLADPNTSAQEAWDGLIDDYVAFLEEGSGWAIRRAVQLIPEIRDLDKVDDEQEARRVAEALRERGARGSPQQLINVGRMLTDTTSAVIEDAWCRHGEVSPSVLAELKLMHRRYLSEYSD